MDSLPLEILHSICQYLSPYHVGEFRLTCRSLADIGVEYLCPTAYIHWMSSSWEILEHPVFSKYIRTVVFTPLQLPNPQELSSDLKSRLKKQGHWRRLVTAYTELKDGDLSTNLSVLEKLSALIRDLPRLREFIPIRWARGKDICFTYDEYGLTEEDLVTRTELGTDVSLSLLQLVSKDNPRLQSISVGFENVYSHGFYRNRLDWPQILQHVKHLRCRVHGLGIELAVRWGRRIESNSFFAELDDIYTLSLTSPLEPLLEEQEALEESLEDEEDEVEDLACAFVQLEEVVLCDHLASLRKLQIEHLIVFESSLSKLSAQSHSLKHLELHTIAIAHTSFASFFQVLGSFNLDSLVMGGMWRSMHSWIHNNKRFFESRRALSMDDHVCMGMTSMGKFIASVLLGKWKFVNDKHQVVEVDHDIEDIMSRLTMELGNPNEKLFSMPAESYTDSGYILFNKDRLIKALDEIPPWQS